MEQLLIYTRHMYFFFLKILKQVVLLSKLLNLVWSVLIMMMAMKVLMMLWSSIYEMGWVFFFHEHVMHFLTMHEAVLTSQFWSFWNPWFLSRFYIDLLNLLNKAWSCYLHSITKKKPHRYALQTLLSFILTYWQAVNFIRCLSLEGKSLFLICINIYIFCSVNDITLILEPIKHGKGVVCILLHKMVTVRSSANKTDCQQSNCNQL